MQKRTVSEIRDAVSAWGRDWLMGWDDMPDEENALVKMIAKLCGVEVVDGVNDERSR